MLCSSLLSNCKWIISGWSLPIRIVTFLSPVSRTLMSAKWGYFLTSPLVATCLNVEGRLHAVNTWLSFELCISFKRLNVQLNLKVGPFLFTIDRRHRNTSRLHIIQIQLPHQALEAETTIWPRTLTWVTISLAPLRPLILTGTASKHTRGRLVPTTPTVTGSLGGVVVLGGLSNPILAAIDPGT